eukprot:Opistho-1_new@78113
MSETSCPKMRMLPCVGFSNPEISRRHVVLPDPDGPSMAKKLPSAMVRSTPSTALTGAEAGPKWRETEENSTAADMRGPDMTGVSPARAGVKRGEPRRVGGSAAPVLPEPRVHPPSAAADDPDVIRHPAVIGHAGPFALAAIRHRRGPEPDLVEVIQAVRRAALGGLHTAPVGAGRRNRRVRAEPDREVRLQVRRKLVVEPLVGAVRVLAVDVQHRGIGPTRRALLRDGRGDGLAIGFQQVDLERPRPRGDDTFVLEIVDLDEGIVPVTAGQRALHAQQVERRLVLVLVQFVRRFDAQFRLVEHQVLRGIGDVDRSVIGLHAALVRLAVGQVHLFEHDVPAGRRLLEHLGVVHQHVGAPHIGHAVMLAVDGVPARILQAGVDGRP